MAFFITTFLLEHYEILFTRKFKFNFIFKLKYNKRMRFQCNLYAIVLKITYKIIYEVEGYMFSICVLNEVSSNSWHSS